MPESIRDENTGVTLQVNDDGSINTKSALILSSVDIQIGAVELKDESSSTRANVIDAGTYNALITRDADEAQKTPICVYDSELIGTSATLTMSTHTATTGKIFNWKGVILTGEEIGQFEMLVGTASKAVWRNSGSEQGREITFPEPLKLTAGQVANVKVSNLSKKSKMYYTTILGYERPI